MIKYMLIFDFLLNKLDLKLLLICLYYWVRYCQCI